MREIEYEQAPRGQPHRSVSQLTSWARCPLAYYLSRVYRDREGRPLSRSPAAWLIQGSAVHKAIEVYETSYRSMPTEHVLATYEDTWADEEESAWYREPDPAGWQKSGMKKTETDLADRKIRGKDQVLTYIENTAKERLRPWTLPDTGWVASEVPFEVDFDGITVRGFIDLVMEDPSTGALLVRDIKTGSKKPIGPIQLGTYRFALRKKYGVDPKWGDYWMCKDDGPSSLQYLGGIPEVLITSQYQIMDAAEREGMYGANVGDHCGRCDVARHCPFVGGEAPEGIYFLGT